MKYNLELDDQPDPEELHLAFMCRSGRHRGVAQARITRWVLEDLGYTVVTTVHVNKDKWNHCDSCFYCSDRSYAMKQRIRRDAIALFAAL